MEKVYYIYLLKNPNTGHVVYVGCTSDFKQRARSHRHNFKKKYGFTPKAEIIEAYKSERYATRREWKLISHLSKLTPLYQNTTNYNQGGIQITDPNHKKRVRKTV